MQWLDRRRIPEGNWPFLWVVAVGLRELKSEVGASIDLTEGTGHITITGRLTAYRHAVARRILDLAEATVLAWNAGSCIGAIACSRSLMETLATFHSLLVRADAAASSKDWEKIGRLVDAYAWSTMTGPGKSKKGDEQPARIKETVLAFIKATQPGSEQFWEQLCDAAHPNGALMMQHAGTLRNSRYETSISAESETVLFVAVYNCLSSCNWLMCSSEDFQILLERIESGSEKVSH